MLCRQLDLFGRELLAVDGTRIKAVNSKDRNFTRAALAVRNTRRISTKAMPTKAADGGDVGRDNKLAEKIAAIRGRRERHKALLNELDRTGEDQISLADPDARAMARMTKVGVGYNVQLAVDTKHKLIVEQEVINQVMDMGLLAPTVSGLLQCSVCGAGYTVMAKDRYGCAMHVKAGTCSNGSTISRTALERRVLDALRDKMMAPDAMAESIVAYNDEVAAARAAAPRERAARAAGMVEVDRKLSGIVDAIENGPGALHCRSGLQTSKLINAR